MKARTLRSAAHRRILTWLRHGPATVSEIAEQFDMQMPHASLACRQLRTDGLIVRDETGGLRNAPMYLSQLGIERLAEDALGKLKVHASKFQDTTTAMVLHADDANVVVGYTEIPKSSLVFIPDADKSVNIDSNGNEGGTWVHAPIAGVQWYALDDFTPVEPPLPTTSGTLEDYQQAPTRVGLVRGEVFESTGYTTLIEGQRFAAGHQPHHTPPSRLSEGDSVLGNVSGTSFPFSPSPGLFAHLPSSLDRSLVSTALGRDGLEVTDRFARKHRTLPFSVLFEWLHERHSRMSEEKLANEHAALVEALTNQPATLSPSIKRALQMDFGEVVWEEDVAMTGLVDIYGMSRRGVRCLLHHVFRTAEVPFCIDWPFDAVQDNVLDEALAHPLCSVWMVRKHGLVSSQRLQPNMKFTNRLAVVQVRLGSHISVAVNLSDTEQAAGPTLTSTGFPSTALELISSDVAPSKAPFSTTLPLGEVGNRLRRALAVFPRGDEVLANQWERSDPLASWIASPSAQRSSRWTRLQDSLPTGWTDLVTVGEVALGELPLAMAKASHTWQQRALLRLQTELDSDPTVLLSLIRGLEHGENAGWYAACLLAVLNPNEARHDATFQAAMSIWFDSPHLQKEVIERVFSHERLNQASSTGLLNTWVLAGTIQPKHSVLALWSEAVQTLQAQEPWLPDRQRVYMAHLPEAWWAPYANEWLVAQLSSASGRAWLRDHRICWPALLCLPEGQRGGLPGATTQHPAFDVKAEPYLGVKMLGEGVGVAMLNDVYEMVYAAEHGLSAPTLPSHPFVSWLVRPPEQWPMFDETVMSTGDEQIGRLLFARSFASRMPSGSR